MFRQTKQNRAFEDIVFQIQNSIISGELKPGDKLPSENKLLEIFKISRGTLREALRVLEQKGLIKVKTGVKGGAIVCSIDTQPVSDSLDLLLQFQKISLGELAKFREVVEGIVAAEAAKKAKKEDIQYLQFLLKSINNKLLKDEFDWDEVVKEEKEFHLKLANIGGNRIFETVLKTVYDNINRYFEKFLPRNKEILKISYQDLCKILKAIKEKKSNKALLLVQRHIKRFNKMMEGKNQSIDPNC